MPTAQSKPAILLTVALTGLVFCAAGSTALAQQAAAAAVDTSSWECEYCPFEEGDIEADIEAGAGYADDAAAKFGDYRGLEEDGAFAVFSGSVRQGREDGWRWSAEARDLGLDARSLVLQADKPGLIGISLGYDKLPHTVFDTTASPFLESGSSERALSLPAGFVRSGVTQQMSTLGASLHPIEIGIEREAGAAGVEFAINRRWSTFARFRHEERDGTRRHGGAFAFSAVELPHPVDEVTDSIALGVVYDAGRFNARVGYDGSIFDNRIHELRFANPYTGTAEGRLAPAPGNTAHVLDANMNWRLGRRTLLSATAAVGQLSQDEDLLPYTTNPVLVVGPLPRAAFDGKVDTTHLSLAVATDLGGVWDFLEGFGVRADVRYDDRDNRSSRDTYAYVVTDTFNSGPETNLPYSFERLRYRLTGAWNLRRLLPFLPAGQRVRLSGGWQHDERERDLQEVAESFEDMAWGRLSYRPTPWLDLAVKLGGANRDVDPYVQPVEQVGAPQNLLLRKYNLADRERDFAEAEVTFTPFERLSLTASADYSSNDYVNSPLGLYRSRDAGANLDVSWAIGEAANLAVFYGWNESDAHQRGSQSFGAADWKTVTEDITRSGGASLRLPRLGSRLAVDLDWYFSNTHGDIAAFAFSGDSFLPPLRTRMNGGQIAARYQWSPALSIHAAVRYERFDSDDWQLDSVGPATTPTLLSLGADAYDYDAKLFTLSFRYRFGASEVREAETEEEE